MLGEYNADYYWGDRDELLLVTYRSVSKLTELKLIYRSGVL